MATRSGATIILRVSPRPAMVPGDVSAVKWRRHDAGSREGEHLEEHAHCFRPGKPLDLTADPVLGRSVLIGTEGAGALQQPKSDQEVALPDRPVRGRTTGAGGAGQRLEVH